MGGMETRRLGRTEHHSSVAILGGAAFWDATAEEGAAGLQLAMDRGVNHLDIAPQYGKAEVAVGPAIPAVRDRLFVAGKTLRANADGVQDQFDETRRRLGCEVLDLYQAHGVVNVDELDRRGPGIERMLQLRDQGACRFVGITGHDLTVAASHLEALRRYDLDTVMFPIYPRLWADPVYREDAEALLAECERRDVGVMVIKAAARRPWADGRPLTDVIAGDPATSERWATSWYEPVASDEQLRRNISFALSTPGVHAFCTPGDTEMLPRVLDAADAASPLSDAERAAAISAMEAEAVIFPIPR
jgi:aryl-alcohol dehydrogenase-like predicted oxidoreductase